MEFFSSVYELLHRCELMGMHPPRGWDIMPENLLLEACRAFLGVKHG